MDLVQTIAVASGLAWGSGFRLYAVVFAAGILSHFGHLHLPGSLAVLANPWVLTGAGIMLLAEFIADKIPVFDSAWDAIHTFIRIPAGAILAALALGEHDPALITVASLVGGTLAAGTHFTKAGTRALVNTSPEPFSNWASSVGEDIAAPVGLYIAFMHPLAFLVLLGVFVLCLGWLLPKLWRFIRRLWSPKRGVRTVS